MGGAAHLRDAPRRGVHRAEHGGADGRRRAGRSAAGPGRRERDQQTSDNDGRAFGQFWTSAVSVMVLLAVTAPDPVTAIAVQKIDVPDANLTSDDVPTCG